MSARRSNKAYCGVVLPEPLIPEDDEFFGLLLIAECDFFIELARWLFIELDFPCVPLDAMSEPDIDPLPDMPAPWLMPPPDMPAPPPDV